MGRCDNVVHDVNNKCDYITKSKGGGGEKDNMCALDNKPSRFEKYLTTCHAYFLT